MPILAKLDKPSLTPSIRPSHAAATPIEARNAGMSVVAISWDQSENRLASPMPSTVRFNQRMSARHFFSGVDEGAVIAAKGPSNCSL